MATPKDLPHLTPHTGSEMNTGSVKPEYKTSDIENLKTLIRAAKEIVENNLKQNGIPPKLRGSK